MCVCVCVCTVLCYIRVIILLYKDAKCSQKSDVCAHMMCSVFVVVVYMLPLFCISDVCIHLDWLCCCVIVWNCVPLLCH